MLMEAKAASEAAAGAGRAAVDGALAPELRAKYPSVVGSVFELLPPGPPPRRRHTGGWSDAPRKAWNMATRLRDDASQVLRLLDDTAVPFTKQRRRNLAPDGQTARQDIRPVPQPRRCRGLCCWPFLPPNSSQARREPTRCPAPAVHHRALVAGRRCTWLTHPAQPGPTRLARHPLAALRV